MGATVDGEKELIAVVDGYREGKPRRFKSIVGVAAWRFNLILSEARVRERRNALPRGASVLSEHPIGCPALFRRVPCSSNCPHRAAFRPWHPVRPAFPMLAVARHSRKPPETAGAFRSKNLRQCVHLLVFSEHPLRSARP